MARPLRWLRNASLAVLGGIGGIGLLIVVLLYATLPPRHGQMSLPGLAAPVAVRFDPHGIPLVQAANARDAAEALGYLHAQNRLFQMDLMRRAAAGRLAELFGPIALGNDVEMRRLGIAASADSDIASLSPAARAMLQAYADGVNAWIARRGRLAAPEYLVLGRPAPWRISDSLLFGKTMGLWLSGNWQTEMERLALAGGHPRDRIDALWPGIPGLLTEDSDARSTGLGRAAARVLGWMRVFPQPFTQPAQASNEFAVSGARTASGKPLLAGDPHLGFGFPSLWYLARIETPAGTLAGATAPGLPFLVIGDNGRVAWTFTSAGADVQDVFVEHPTADGGSYQAPGGALPFGRRTEVIHVAWHKDVVLHVLITRHGPVVGTTADGKALLAVEMGNLAPDDTDADALLTLNDAATIGDVRRAAELLTSPVQNLLAADASHIAFFSTGRVPIRRAGDGSWPQDGADGRHDWVGMAGSAQLPSSVDPASGALINTNNPTAGPDFPVWMGRDVYGDWRARRIHSLLAAPRQTAASFARIQTDVTSVYAQALLPRLLALRLPPGDAAASALALLRGWHGRMAMNLPQPLIFNAWTREIVAEALRRNGFDPDTAPVEPDNFLYVLLGPGDTRAAQAMWCNGDCDGLLHAALEAALDRLRRRYGGDPAAWRWGVAHPALFAHPVLGNLPWVGGLGRFSIAAPGDGTTVNVAAPSPTAADPDGFTALHGPELRAIFDLADLDASLFMIAPGESGNLLSAQAADLLRPWRDGDYIRLGPAQFPGPPAMRLLPGR